MCAAIAELETELHRTTNPRVKIDLLNEIAWQIHLDDQEKARNLAEQAYSSATSGAFEVNPYLAGLVGSLRNLAALNNDSGRYDEALQQSLRAMEILEGLYDDQPETRAMTIDVLGQLSWTYRCYADYVIAIEYAMKALKLAQSTGDRKNEIGMLNILSVIYAESNDLRAALEMGQKIADYCHEEKFTRGESIALNNLAMTYLELGDGEQALATCQASLSLAQENSIDAVAITALSTLGEVYLGLQDYAHAEFYLKQGLDLARHHQAGSDVLQCLLNLGKIYLNQQNNQAALSVLTEALSLSQACSDRRGEYLSHRLLSEVYESQQVFEAALKHFKQFHLLKETIFNESSNKRLAGLKVINQVETAKRDAEIQHLKTIELRREIEERKSAQEALEKLAEIDPLTGALNRRKFFNLGERAVEVALQTDQPLTAILIDLDLFKGINDTYGHAIGDQVLIQATRIMSDSLRQGEIIARYGGDEFVILLPDIHCEQAEHIARRIRDHMATRSIHSTRGDIALTLSLGIAELQATGSRTLDALLDLADQALYAAKRSGRNQQKVYSAQFSTQDNKP